ncbi:16S rRNA (guanine(966)-N(2))-methyltransferase RsmD [Paralimibaculum aggregatum]|uniref:16S rRNA (Guanine(966)-N(2))-methyltransferase RsmD n=1 Tax=Paralimibaculum aggregatum TaxID=3036245 RepID=A0ABQ6LGB7_9RHOB|nr:16S rRNA (guanine(966)-N(2))-methyltransferase RsmD [Limibaculum sp. NKW23]GMG81069.1 16S rRNA (guanine(966)-N(2))-methyltransferase RsmD [Limibaculum sp. NKW23]
MRIVGGRFGGHRLAAPGADGGGAAHLRPTSDRVREALFNLLAHGAYPPLEGARVLDLFAGTGALGLEALSRGAARAVFVDDFPKSRALIRENVERLGLTGVSKIWRRDATRLGPCRDAPFDLVFLDPPYGSDLGLRAHGSALAGGWLAPGALLVWESPAAEPAPAPEGAEAVDSRRYGESRITLLLQGAAAG